MGFLSKNFNYKGYQCIWDSERDVYHIYNKNGLHVGKAYTKDEAKALVDANR